MSFFIQYCILLKNDSLLRILRFPGYFETPLFWTFFHFPWDFEIAGFNCISKNPSRCRLLIGQKNAFYYCAHSANSFSWVLFVSSYTTAIVLITACLAHAPKKCSQSGNFHFDIKSPSDFKILSARKLNDACPKIQAWAYNRYSLLHRSRLV